MMANPQSISSTATTISNDLDATLRQSELDARACGGGGCGGDGGGALSLPPAKRRCVAGAAASDWGSSVSTSSSTPTPPVGTRRYRNLTTISRRACVVCGLEDRPGEKRSKGFKCHECIGIPSNPRLVTVADEMLEARKGRGADGGFVFNDYTVVTFLGSGGFGRVFLAVHNVSNQAYAVKILAKERMARARMVDGGAGAGADTEDDPFLAVKNEISILKNLDHPNIVQCIGYTETDAEFLILTEYMEGGQIYPSVYPAEPLRLGLLECYAVAIASGLEYMHDRKVVHRDVKPANILLGKNGQVKLTDFGVSQCADMESEGFVATGFAGTPAFMPPEAFQRQHGPRVLEGEATDCWSFGVTLFTMAFGRLPFKGSALGTMGDELRRQATSLEVRHESALFNNLVQSMLKVCPSERPAMHGMEFALTPHRTTRFTLHTHTHTDIIRDDFCRHVRIVKGQPIETIEATLEWDDAAQTLRVAGGSDDVGAAQLRDYFRRSGGTFTLSCGSGQDYELRLYDRARDPMRRPRRGDTSPCPSQQQEQQQQQAVLSPPVGSSPSPSPAAGFTPQEWGESEMLEEMT